MFAKHYVHSHLGLVLRNIKPMKHNLQHLFIFFLVSVIFLSCGILTKGYNDYKSAKFFYKKHDYHQATIYASKSLKLNSKNKMALNLFEKSYPLAVEQHKSNIIKLENIDDDSKWPELYYVYAQLQNLSDEITYLQSIIKLENMNAPAILKYEINLFAQDYNKDLNSIGPLAAEYKYKKGLELRKKKDKENQKMAAKAFKLAQQFVPNYKNSKELYDETRAAALLTLLILPFEGNRNLVNYIRDQIVMIQTNKPKEFLQILTRDQLRSTLSEQEFQLSGMVNDDQIIEIGELAAANQFLSASLITTHRPSATIIMENIEQKKRIVVRREKYFDENGKEKIKKIKEDVYATVAHYKKNANANLKLTYRITDVKNGLSLYSGMVKTDAEFFHEWATFEGDKRALSNQYARLVRKKEKFSPSRSELLMQAAQPLPNKLVRKIFDHYSE
tara:strand:- start:147 stop:1481 length:1335 start_codon:yes stop_codon:yes gene_type:complete